ncbi:MAG: sugar transferase [Bacteroidia bacterium]|nr:MAG: sugar transferase [Bacteroidia bacterium]
MYKNYGKRIIDLLGASILLILFTPLLVIILIIYRLRKEKPFFVQLRPGKNEKLFPLIKLRTMREPKEGENIHAPERITTWGKFLRKTSLDEIPQLWNVLKGDMSLVGPRPLLIEYLSLYSEEQKKRHTVKPGITGYAQIHGRNLLSWKKKLELDIYYAENYNLWLDLYILFMTPFAIGGTEPPEPFNGSN